jgi:lipoprotein-releasing system permease protein
MWPGALPAEVKLQIMPFELFLALRYLRSRRKRRLARATAVAAVAGIAVGVAALIVTLSLANGFREEMRDKILQGTAHLTVMRSDGMAMSNYEEVAARVRSIDGVTAASGTTYDGVVAIGPKNSSYAVVRGIDTNGDEIKKWIIEGSWQQSSNNVAVGSELASRCGLHAGSTVELVPASANAETTSRRAVKVTAIFRSGLFEYDSAWIYLPLDQAATLAGSAHSASVVSVQVKDIDRFKDIGARVSSALGNSYTVIDWQEANRPLFTALALERRMGLLIVGLIILIATLNITTMLILVVVERRRDIAILNAMGAGKPSITALFMMEGAVIGLLGSISGLILGFVVCVIGNRYQLVSLPADVYSISHVPFRPEPLEMVLAIVVAFGLSVLATIYPARAATRMRPAETLRDAS